MGELANSLRLDSPPLIATAGDVSRPPAPVVDELAGLTRRLVAGDEPAWHAFHDAYYPRLLRYLLVVTRGDEQAARDAVQATFVRAARHIRAFDDEAALWSWLTRLARSALVDDHRRHRRYLGLLERFLRWSPPADDRDQVDADARLGALLQQLLASLPEDERLLLEQKYLAGEPVRSLALTRGQSEKAIESRLGRIRLKLRETLLHHLRHES